jgi:pSer/pThr/pTyr-binding forkhead associated (FHA) protein
LENAVCHFVFYTGPRKGEAQVFNTARVSIGRAANCDFRLEAFQLEQVAPHHAELLLEEGRTWCLYDLGTKSGTWVNGERVHERCILMSEDYLRFGQDGPEVIFRVGQPTHGRQPLPEVFPVTAELEFFSGSDAGRIFPINAAVTSNIGRRADLEVPLDPRGDMIVSGNHCNIRYVNGHFVLTDTSRNGTYVNNELVDQPMEILDADVIMLGDGGPQARFHVDEAKRHYPNHRALSPVAKRAEPKATSSFSPTPTHTPAAPAVLASAKPFKSGTAVPPSVQPPPADAALSPEAAAINQDVAAAEHLQQDASAAGTAAIGAAAAGNPDLPDFLRELSPEDVSEAKAELAPGSVGGAENVSESASAGLAGPGAVIDTPAAAVSASPAVASEIPSAGVSSGPSDLAAVPKPPRQMPRVTLPISADRLKSLGKAGLNYKVVAVVLGIIVLIILIAVFSGDKDDATTGASRGNYAAALQEAEPVENVAAKYTVQVPEGWATLNRDNYVSIESADKNIAVDYVRDPRASEAHLLQLLQKDGATIADKTTLNTKNAHVGVTHTRVGNIRRAGALVPTGSAPIMVTVEATEDAMDKLSDAGLEKLIVGNVAATGAVATPAPAVAAASPAPATPAATNALPTPAPQQTAAPATKTPAADTSAPANAVAAAPAEQATPAASDAATSGPTGPKITSKALKLSLVAPAGWTGTSEEADEMIMLSDGKGLTIRIARDPGDLDAEATFKAMEEEDWKSEGVKNTSRYHAGEFSGKSQNLMLVLVPEKAKTTLLIYATSAKDFTEAQRYGIRDILVQLVQ